MIKKTILNRAAFVLAALLSVNVMMTNTVTVLADEADSSAANANQVCIDDSAAQLYTALSAMEVAAVESAYAQTAAETRVVEVAQTRAFKSYESYRILTKRSSAQKQLQDQATTDVNGFRVLNGRYLVATGNGFGMSVGQNFDLILSNGTVIPCTLGDVKRNCDTDAGNIFSPSGCCSEFIVDTKVLPRAVKRTGNCSKLCTEWDATVTSVVIYSM